MKFGPLDIQHAEGTILAHATKTADGRLPKGRLLTADDIDSLRDTGLTTIVVAKLQPGDIEENEAARRIAGALLQPNITLSEPFTGRVNLFAASTGVLHLDANIINELNRLDPGITIATLPQFALVEAGRMVATIKIIPFAVSGANVEAAITLLEKSRAVDVKAFGVHRVGLIATELPILKPATMDKTRKLLAARLAPSKSAIIKELRVAHRADAVAAAIDSLRENCDLLVIFAASAIVDIDDVIPRALVEAGGEIVHFGMPVDPGNLLLLGKLGNLPVIGAPGCARSPSQNGFDWVLQRLLADIEVSRTDIEQMGVGGLLMEIHSRPQLRNPQSEQSTGVQAIILAAGQSRRMGKTNKLLARLDGAALLQRVASAALDSKAARVTVVTGHQRENVEQLLADLPVDFVYNQDFASGLASSIRIGIASLPLDVAGAMILLGDMPHITANMIDQMIARFAESPAIIQATSLGKGGNPVLWPQQFFEDLQQISGDVGARHLIGQNADQVIAVELGSAAGLDIDTHEELVAQGGDPAEDQ